MSRTTLLVSALAAIFLIAVVAALYQLDDSKTREVVNRYHGGAFAFTYPLGFEIEEYPNGSIAIGSTTGSGFVSGVDLTVAHPSPDVAYESFDQFLKEELMKLCAADAPGEQLSCTEVERTESIENAAGTNLDAYYLVLRHERAGTVATSTFGPIYAYPFPPEEGTHVDNTPFPVLLVHAPLPMVLAGTVDTDLLTRINDSVDIGHPN